MFSTFEGLRSKEPLKIIKIGTAILPREMLIVVIHQLFMPVAVICVNVDAGSPTTCVRITKVIATVLRKFTE